MKIEEIRKLVDAATPGPWKSNLEPMFDKIWYEVRLGGKIVAKTREESNSEFIAATRTLIPLLLDVVEKAEGLINPSLAENKPEDHGQRRFMLDQALKTLEAWK